MEHGTEQPCPQTGLKQTLKEFPKEQQEAEYEKFSGELSRTFLKFDNIFVKNRKIGRKKIPRKKGRPRI